MKPPIGKYSLTTAIARQEGYYAEPPTRPRRNNNPGDIMWDGPNGFAARNGATGGDHGPNTPMAIFPDPDTGFRAYRKLLNLPAQFDTKGKLVHGYVGAKIRQIINRYCPPDAPGNSPEDTAIYLANVCVWMQVRPDDVLTVDMI